MAPSLPDILVLVSLLPGSARLPGVGYHPRLPSSPLHLAAGYSSGTAVHRITRLKSADFRRGSMDPIHPITGRHLLYEPSFTRTALREASLRYQTPSQARLLRSTTILGLLWVVSSSQAALGGSPQISGMARPRLAFLDITCSVQKRGGSPDSTLVLALPGPGYSRFRSRGGPVSLDVPKGLYGVTVFRSAHFDIP